MRDGEVANGSNEKLWVEVNAHGRLLAVINDRQVRLEETTRGFGAELKILSTVPQQLTDFLAHQAERDEAAKEKKTALKKWLGNLMNPAAGIVGLYAVIEIIGFLQSALRSAGG